MKTLVADINATDGIIRVHTPEKLTEQETAKSARAEVLKKKLNLKSYRTHTRRNIQALLH